VRVTNNMMRNNSTLNMQKNKVAYDKYLQQYTTQKKIQRPSDDPTIAVRALKYRTTISEIDQYLKNIEDATSWMNATETVLKDIDKRLDTMVDVCTEAATGTVNAKDRENLVKQLRENASYIFEQDANQDYAGRYLFTGYRTDVPLLFEENQTNVTYHIQEKLEINDINKYEYVYGQPVYDDAKTDQDYAQEASKFQTTHRILVSYDNCDDAGVVIRYKDKDGNEQTVTAVNKKIGDDTVFNEHLQPGDDEIYFVEETGELVFGDKIYDKIRGGSDLQVEYEKTKFNKGQIRPEHYFDCTTTDNGTGKTITENTPDGRFHVFSWKCTQKKPLTPQKTVKGTVAISIARFALISNIIRIPENKKFQNKQTAATSLKQNSRISSMPRLASHSVSFQVWSTPGVCPTNRRQ